MLVLLAGICYTLSMLPESIRLTKQSLIDMDEYRAAVGAIRSTADLAGLETRTDGALVCTAFLVRSLLSTLGRSQVWSEGFRGLRVLELGPGSASGPDGVYIAHFSRIAAINGALVDAVDIYPPLTPHEPYHHINCDFVPYALKGGLSGIPGLRSDVYDIVEADGLFGWSPSLVLTRTLATHRQTPVRFQPILHARAFEMVAPGGVMHFEDTFVRKQ